MVPLHLPVLMSMFPGASMLNIDQIALATKYSTGHLYNLNSVDKLPFKLSRGLGNKFFVSIVEMAAWMDNAMLSQPPADEASESKVAKKKVGRPRNSSKAGSERQAFLADLFAAIEKIQGVERLPGGPALVPLFMDIDGLVHAMPLAEPPLNDLESFQQPHEVRWLTLEDAFAAVWRGENSRLDLLAKANATKPGLSERVKAQREATLGRI